MKHLNSSIEIGSVFSKWTVIDRAANGTDNQKRWKVVCICGNKGIVANYELQSERSKGCRSCRSARKGTHYQTKSPEYRVFNGMWSRCTNPKDLYYELYSDKTPSEDWRKFENFYRDMGPRPSAEHSLERKNNNLGYSKENCVWATSQEQARNKSNNRIITIRGQAKCLAEWLEIAGFSKTCFYYRLKQGWSEERALTTPTNRVVD